MPTLTMDQALDRYRQLVGPVNANKNVATVRKWLLWGGQPTDASLTAYVRELQKRGYKAGTIDGHVRTIQSFYRKFKIPAPRVVGFKFDSMQDSERVALSSDAMRTLMAAALNPESGLDAYQRAILAVSLVYGPRANELAAIQPRDVEAERIYIRTSKSGRPRHHFVPELLRPLLDIDWPEVSTAYIERQFGVIWALVFGTEKPSGVAWHGIRRGLVRDLVAAGVSERAVGQFMRWSRGKASDEFAMIDPYAHPNHEAGAEGKAPVARTEAGSYEEDAAVWARHPMLNC